MSAEQQSFLKQYVLNRAATSPTLEDNMYEAGRTLGKRLAQDANDAWNEIMQLTAGKSTPVKMFETADGIFLERNDACFVELHSRPGIYYEAVFDDDYSRSQNLLFNVFGLPGGETVMDPGREDIKQVWKNSPAEGVQDDS
jgi:hypothetical protein